MDGTKQMNTPNPKSPLSVEEECMACTWSGRDDQVWKDQGSRQCKLCMKERGQDRVGKPKTKTSHIPCVSCSVLPTDKCHIRSRGAGGGWDDDNIMQLCRKCHSMQHAIGWYQFSKDSPSVLVKLDEKGWEFQEIFGVMKLVKKE